jgi:hypothetical protein
MARPTWESSPGWRACGQRKPQRIRLVGWLQQMSAGGRDCLRIIICCVRAAQYVCNNINSQQRTETAAAVHARRQVRELGSLTTLAQHTLMPCTAPDSETGRCTYYLCTSTVQPIEQRVVFYLTEVDLCAHPVAGSSCIRLGESYHRCQLLRPASQQMYKMLHATRAAFWCPHTTPLSQLAMACLH